MKRKAKATIAMLLTFILLVQSAAFYSVSAADDSIYDKMVRIANQEVGYMETTYPDGTFTSKYGEWYGIPNGAWCAMFCSWCANQAGISTEVLPKFASCHVGMDWFKNKNLWRERSDYIPEPGNLIFLNDCTHVGIVEKYDDGMVYTIEGNACDDNQENYGVRKRYYSALSSKITGYGLPDKEVALKFNGKAIKKETAYMLPDTSSQTVWEVWENDDLEVLCKDGEFYLVMYPFLSTGKFVCAYVPQSAVSVFGDVPEAVDFYTSRRAFVRDDSQIYHNPSDAPLMSSAGVDKKVRAEMTKYESCQLLFEKDGYDFIKTQNGITGFIQPQKLEILIESNLLLGDINGDGCVDQADMDDYLNYLTRNSNGLNKFVADVNLDGNSNVDDLNYLLRVSDHKLIETHVGKPLSQVYSLLGDTDKDGFITTNDAQFLLKNITHGSNDVDLKQGDANFDKKLSALDARIIARYVEDATSNDNVGKPAADFYTVLGDVDGDGQVTTADAELLTTAIANNSTMTDKKKKAADVSLDGAIDSKDVDAINSFLNGSALNEYIGKEICIFDEIANVVPTTAPVTDNKVEIETTNPTTIPVTQPINQTNEEISELMIGDVDGDGAITITDATLIQLYVGEMIDKFPAQDKINPTTPTIPSQPTTVKPTDPPATIPVVTDPPVVDVSSIWVPESIQVTIDENTPVYYQVFPDSATDKRLSWLSADDSIATVSNEGIVSGKKIGSTTIFVVATNGVKASVPVTVVNKFVSVDSVSISNSNPAPVNSGTGIQLNAIVEPNNATEKGIEWTSSNPDVASVNSSGYVTTKAAGTVTVTATSISSGKKSTATIKVNQLTSYIPNDNYCFKLKGTNSYLDHQGGGTHGTNVLLWEGDGNSNPNQKIKLERIDDNRYKLWSATSTNLMLDVNRGNSYSDPLKIGLNIDLWENNDWEAQEWLFTKTYDGYYIIRLNMLQEGAMEASGTNNGDNIFYGTYNCDNDRQKWELITTPGPVPLPESTMWVCNTGDVGNVHVRSGPGSNYASIGGFNEGQEVTVIGDTNAEWLKVRGTNRHNGETIEGYSHRDYYTPNPPSTPHTDGPTKQDGVNWANNHIGQSVDTDGMYGAQCKDFVNAYTQELFGVTFPGNANALIWDSLPAGWTRIQNYAEFVPEPGDIAIWDGWGSNPYGHTAVIISANVNTFESIDQNWYNANGTTGSPAARVTHNYTNPKFWGVLRPPFKG